MEKSHGREPMAAQPNSMYPTPTLRTHRPLQADTLTAPRADATHSFVTEPIPKKRTWLQKHVFHIGLGMFVTSVLWVAITGYIIPFATDKIDHWNYGAARIS